MLLNRSHQGCRLPQGEFGRACNLARAAKEVEDPEMKRLKQLKMMEEKQNCLEAPTAVQCDFSPGMMATKLSLTACPETKTSCKFSCNWSIQVKPCEETLYATA